MSKRPENTAKDYERAADLRKNAPRAEQKLWDALRSVKGFRFRRQQPLYPYIVDFACLKARLVVELDGASHDARQAYDNQRELYLTRPGYRVLRFSNDAVFDDVEAVVATILRECDRGRPLTKLG